MADFDWYPLLDEEIGEDRTENYNFDSAINYTVFTIRDNFSAPDWYINLGRGLQTECFDRPVGVTKMASDWQPIHAFAHLWFDTHLWTVVLCRREWRAWPLNSLYVSQAQGEAVRLADAINEMNRRTRVLTRARPSTQSTVVTHLPPLACTTRRWKIVVHHLAETLARYQYYALMQ